MPDTKTFIVAEAAHEHMGDFKRARKLIDVAKDSGADAIKFIFFFGSFPKYKHLQLGRNQWLNLWGHAHDIGLPIFATCLDPPALNFAQNILDMRWFKIPSGLAANWKYLMRVMDCVPEKVFYSTGMCTEQEVLTGATILAQSDLTVMHCTTAYPPPDNEVNLRAITSLRDDLGFHQIGFSDHTLGIELSLAAVALGATVIEKHITLDGKGPDGEVSLEPWQLTHLVKQVRRQEAAMGIGKCPTKSELEVRAKIRGWQGEVWK